MQTIYIVLNDATPPVPIMACESYKDASEAVNSLYGRSMAKKNKHIYSVPYNTDTNRPVALDTVRDVVDIAVFATISAYSHLQTLEECNEEEQI